MIRKYLLHISNFRRPLDLLRGFPRSKAGCTVQRTVKYRAIQNLVPVKKNKSRPKISTNKEYVIVRLVFSGSNQAKSVLISTFKISLMTWQFMKELVSLNSSNAHVTFAKSLGSIAMILPCVENEANTWLCGIMLVKDRRLLMQLLVICCSQIHLNPLIFFVYLD